MDLSLLLPIVFKKSIIAVISGTVNLPERSVTIWLISKLLLCSFKDTPTTTTSHFSDLLTWCKTFFDDFHINPLSQVSPNVAGRLVRPEGAQSGVGASHLNPAYFLASKLIIQWGISPVIKVFQ